MKTTPIPPKFLQLLGFPSFRGGEVFGVTPVPAAHRAMDVAEEHRRSGNALLQRGDFADAAQHYDQGLVALLSSQELLGAPGLPQVVPSGRRRFGGHPYRCRNSSKGLPCFMVDEDFAWEG